MWVSKLFRKWICEQWELWWRTLPPSLFSLLPHHNIFYYKHIFLFALSDIISYYIFFMHILSFQERVSMCANHHRHSHFYYVYIFYQRKKHTHTQFSALIWYWPCSCVHIFFLVGFFAVLHYYNIHNVRRHQIMLFFGWPLLHTHFFPLCYHKYMRGFYQKSKKNLKCAYVSF